MIQQPERASKPIITLTLSPTIDLAFQSNEIRPIRKNRTVEQRIDAGGGGINVARVLKELGAEAYGPYAQPTFPDATAPTWTDNTALPTGAAPAVARYLAARAQSIYGGSNEIQKNIIAKAILGL